METEEGEFEEGGTSEGFNVIAVISSMGTRAIYFQVGAGDHLELQLLSRCERSVPLDKIDALTGRAYDSIPC